MPEPGRTGMKNNFGSHLFIAIVFIVGAPMIVAPLMGVDINSFCTVGEGDDGDDDECSQNALFSADVTNLISVALNAIRIGGAVIIIVAFGIKGIQYRFDACRNRHAA